MSRVGEGALFLSVVVLLALAMGTALSGVGPNAGFFFGSPPSHTTSQGSQVTRSTTFTSGSSSSVTVVNVTVSESSQTTVSTTQSTEGQSPQGTTGGGFSFEPVTLYSLAILVACLGGLMVAALMRLQKPKVVDLRGEIDEMERQRRRFLGTWSMRLRNAALLRYYSLMANACAGAGILDSPPYTPHEFVGLASAELEMPAPDAERFADMVDRAHYGGELTSDEVKEAASFMDAFTKGIMGRLGVE